MGETESIVSAGGPIGNVVHKTENIFFKYVLPIAGIAIGYFVAPLAFSWLANWLSTVNIKIGSSGDLYGAFGDKRNGVLLTMALILAGIGFALFTMGGYIRIAGLFILGCALRAGIDGFNNGTWKA
jgi:hypothetical protein